MRGGQGKASRGTGRGTPPALQPQAGGQYEAVCHTAVGGRQSAGRDVRARVREWVGQSAACPSTGARGGRSPGLGEGPRVVHRRDAAACGWAPEKSCDPQKSRSRTRWRQIGRHIRGGAPLAVAWGTSGGAGLREAAGGPATRRAAT